MTERAFSPTALQHFAACPYRFFLQAIHRLAPREEPAVEALDPLTRGAIFHEVQFAVLSELRARDLLPVRTANLDAHARRSAPPRRSSTSGPTSSGPPSTASGTTASTASVPTCANGSGARRPRTTAGTVALRALLRSRGPRPEAVRPGERRGGRCGSPASSSSAARSTSSSATRAALRATDHKTGKTRPKAGVVVGGGTVLQPLLYALAAEEL
jgi:hypothetical protein